MEGGSKYVDFSVTSFLNAPLPHLKFIIVGIFTTSTRNPKFVIFVLQNKLLLLKRRGKIYCNILTLDLCLRGPFNNGYFFFPSLSPVLHMY